MIEVSFRFRLHLSVKVHFDYREGESDVTSDRFIESK